LSYLEKIWLEYFTQKRINFSSDPVLVEIQLWKTSIPCGFFSSEYHILSIDDLSISVFTAPFS